MFRKIIGRLCCAGAFLSIASTLGHATELKDSGDFAAALLKHKSQRSPILQNYSDIQPIDKNTLTRCITGNDIDFMIKDLPWKANSLLLEVFNQRYEITLNSSCWYLNHDSNKTLVVFDKQLYDADVESIFDYCKELYEQQLTQGDTMIIDNSTNEEEDVPEYVYEAVYDNAFRVFADKISIALKAPEQKEVLQEIKEVFYQLIGSYYYTHYLDDVIDTLKEQIQYLEYKPHTHTLYKELNAVLQTKNGELENE